MSEENTVVAPTPEEMKAVEELVTLVLEIAAHQRLDISQVVKACTSIPIMYISLVETENKPPKEAVDRMKNYAANSFEAGRRFLIDGILPTDPMGMINGYGDDDEQAH